MFVRCVAPPVSLGGVIAHQVDCLGPYLPPDVHVVAQIDGTAYSATSSPHHLSVVCTNRARTSERTVRVTLIFIWVAKVSHFIIPCLYMKGWGSVSSPVCPQILSNGGQQARGAMFPQTHFSPGFCRSFQLHIPCLSSVMFPGERSLAELLVSAAAPCLDSALHRGDKDQATTGVRVRSWLTPGDASP